MSRNKLVVFKGGVYTVKEGLYCKGGIYTVKEGFIL